MAEWTEGYVSDIQYTAEFYREMAPSHLAFAAMVFGSTPDAAIHPKRYLELASGQGLGTCLLAAANPCTEFVGIDFNSAQTVNARRLAATAGLTNVQFFDWSFQETLTKPEFRQGEFDVIALHGVYSWITPKNRAAIVEILNRQLKPGGLVYISYNCMPGWAALAPIQHLIRELAARNPERSDRQISNSVRFLTTLKDGGAMYFTANPAVGKRLDQLATLDPKYLAHEYLNANWYPLYSADVAAELRGAKLSFMGSAVLSDGIDAVSVPPGLRTTVQGADDPEWIETIRDYVTNRRFRRDIFARGISKLASIEHRRRLLQTAFTLALPVSETSLKFSSPVGDYEGAAEVYRPLIEAIAKGPTTIAQLAQLPATQSAGVAGLLQALAILVSSGQIFPLLGTQPIDYDAAHRFNRAITGELRLGRPVHYLAAPLAGSGIYASSIDLYALAAAQQQMEHPDEAATHALSIMAGLGQRPLKDGIPILDDDRARTHLANELKPVLTNKLPLWKQLGVL